jgi:hypothetical protein
MSFGPGATLSDGSFGGGMGRPSALPLGSMAASVLSDGTDGSLRMGQVRPPPLPAPLPILCTEMMRAVPCEVARVLAVLQHPVSC